MTPAAVVSLVGLALVFVGQAVIFGRWTGRLQVLVERHDEEIGRLRQWKHHELPPVIAELQSKIIGLEAREEARDR